MELTQITIPRFRVWDRPSRGAHPSIYHTKKLLQQVAASARLALFIDIHGHSTKEDVFFYGCEPNLVNLPGGNATTTGGGGGAGGGGGGSNSGSSSNMSSARDQRGSGRNGNNSNWTGGSNGWANSNNGGGGGGASWQVLSEGDREGPLGPQSTSGGGACANGGMQVTGSSATNSGGGTVPGAGGGAPSTSQNGTAPPQGNGTGVEAGRVGLTPRAAARLRVRMLPYLCHKASQV